MKKTFFFLVLFPLFLFSQEILPDLDRNVNGIINTSEGAYLILEEGLTQISKTNAYTEYYRRIYNDSTIVNPNTELKEEFNLNIIPFLSPSINEYNRIDFQDSQQLRLFIQLNDNSGYSLTPYAEEIFDSLNLKK